MQFESTAGYIKSIKHKEITTIEFFTVQKNSLPLEMLENLAKAIHHASTDANTNIIILKSGGDGVFCSGASFDELAAIQTETEGLKFFSGFAQVINSMRKSTKIIIGRIHGKCVGGGVGLAAACDYAIAVDTVEIKLSELAVGIGPFVVGPVIERKIGISAFMQLSLDVLKWRNADWAKRKGLLAETHSSLENMDESINRLSESLSHSNPEALIALKKTFWQGCEHWDQLLIERAAISGKLVLSEFTKNAIAKFKEKK